MRREKLSKDAYRRLKSAVDADLSRLGLRKSQLELAMATPGIAANFVEMRRVTSELADVEQALAAVEDAWLDLEERAPSGGSVATPRGSSARSAPPPTSGDPE